MTAMDRTDTQSPVLHAADSLDLIRCTARARTTSRTSASRSRSAGFHGRLRLGQELAAVRRDRRGVAADDQRDLQRLGEETVWTPTGALEIRGATAHNLRDVDVDMRTARASTEPRH
jgi:hypothetical protein